MKRVLFAIGTLAASTSVLADGAFEGPWVGAGMGFRGTNTELTDNTDGVDINGIGKTSIYGVVQGGYGWKLNSDVGDFNVGPYAQYFIGTVTSNTHIVGSSTANAFSANVKWKNQFQIGFQPGYYLGKDTVVYAKVGYSHVSIELNGANANGQVSNSQSFSGPGAGLGLKTQFAGNWVIFVEAQQIWYSSKDYNVRGASIEVKPTMSMGTFGIGYQF